MFCSSSKWDQFEDLTSSQSLWRYAPASTACLVQPLLINQSQTRRPETMTSANLWRASSEDCWRDLKRTIRMRNSRSRMSMTSSRNFSTTTWTTQWTLTQTIEVSLEKERNKHGRLCDVISVYRKATHCHVCVLIAVNEVERSEGTERGNKVVTHTQIPAIPMRPLHYSHFEGHNYKSWCFRTTIFPQRRKERCQLGTQASRHDRKQAEWREWRHGGHLWFERGGGERARTEQTTSWRVAAVREKNSQDDDITNKKGLTRITREKALGEECRTLDIAQIKSNYDFLMKKYEKKSSWFAFHHCQCYEVN